MDFYTLDREFNDVSIIENTKAVIWTERYATAGDIEISLEDTPANRELLKLGTFVSCTDSDEVMLLETREMKEGVLTVKGETITKFLEHRIIRASGYWNATSYDFEFNLPGQLMGFLVEQFCVKGPYADSEFPVFGFNGYRQRIHNLSLGNIYQGGVSVKINLPYGTLYGALKGLAETYGLGFKMYLASSDDNGYSLKFTSYAGTDRTSLGPNPDNLVRFSPTEESLTGSSVIESIAGYKNVCYAYATNWTTPSFAYGMGEAYAPGTSPTATDFDRRVMQIFVDDIHIPEGTPTEDAFGRPPGDPPPGYILPALNSRARDALANNNYTRLVDGEIVPQSAYQYGTHFFLGDIIELGSNEPGFVQRAKITEYIRIKDAEGIKGYPTVSVVS